MARNVVKVKCSLWLPNLVRRGVDKHRRVLAQIDDDGNAQLPPALAAERSELTRVSRAVKSKSCIPSYYVFWHMAASLLRHAWNGKQFQKINRRMLTFMMTPTANIMEASAEPP
jgi:hypothetical protein